MPANLRSSHYPGIVERFALAFKVWYCMIRNQPIVVCMDESSVYARASPDQILEYSGMLLQLYYRLVGMDFAGEELARSIAAIRENLTQIDPLRKN